MNAKRNLWITLMILLGITLSACGAATRDKQVATAVAQTIEAANTPTPQDTPLPSPATITPTRLVVITSTAASLANPTATLIQYPYWTASQTQVTKGMEVEIKIHFPDQDVTCLDANGKRFADGDMRWVLVDWSAHYGTAKCKTVDGKDVSPLGAFISVVDATTSSVQISDACSLTDGTAQMQTTKSVDGKEWLVDPKNLKVVAGYSNTQPGHDVSKLLGCDMWAEYESPNSKEHIIVVLRDDPTKQLAYLGADGLFHIPTPKGGSFWVGPVNWNTGDMTTKKPSIALEMAAERHVNQLRNGYDWPEIVKLPNGKVMTYEVGHVYGAFYSGCTDLKQPEAVNVAGTILGDGYYASIGMEGCRVAVKIDGSWTQWANARDNVMYTTVEAWLFPKGTTEEQVQDWISKK